MANFPSELIINGTDLESVDNSIVSTTSMNGRFTARTRNVQQWMFTATFSRDPKFVTWRGVLADLMQFSQTLGVVTIVHPLYQTIQGTATGVPRVDGATAAGATTVLCGNQPPSQADIFLRGDVVRFTNSTKVYMVTADTASTAGGQFNLSIFPALRKPLVGGGVETIIYADVEFTMRHTENFSAKLSAPHIAAVNSMELVEDLD